MDNELSCVSAPTAMPLFCLVDVLIHEELEVFEYEATQSKESYGNLSPALQG